MLIVRDFITLQVLRAGVPAHWIEEADDSQMQRWFWLAQEQEADLTKIFQGLR